MAYACPDWLKCCFAFTETVGLLGTGAQDVHLDFHTAPELCYMPAIVGIVQVRAQTLVRAFAQAKL